MKFANKAWVKTQFDNFAKRISDVFARKTEIPEKTTITNNYMATKPGTAADAMLAKELKEDISWINSNLLLENIARDGYKDNLLQVGLSVRDHSANRTRLVYNPSYNVPNALSGAAAFLGLWRCYWFNSSHVCVKIEEFYPVCGRIWTNFYNTDGWRGWKSITPQ